MPEINGRRLAQQLRQRQPQAAVLFVSGPDALPTSTASTRNPLEKPYILTDLAYAVGETLDRAAMAA